MIPIRVGYSRKQKAINKIRYQPFYKTYAEKLEIPFEYYIDVRGFSYKKIMEEKRLGIYKQVDNFELLEEV